MLTSQAFRTDSFAGSDKGQGKDMAPTLQGPDSQGHFSNLIEAIRDGKNETLHAEITEGFYSAALPLLGNISYRVGRELKFMGDYEKFANDPEADVMLSRNYRRPFVVPQEV